MERHATRERAVRDGRHPNTIPNEGSSTRDEEERPHVSHLLDARPIDARRAELRIGLPSVTLSAEDGIHFPVPPERWVPCEDLGFSFAFRDEGTESAERTAMGFPAVPAPGRLPAGQVVQLSATPGGLPFATLGPSESVRHVFVLESRDGFSRVLLHHWGGAMLFGWLEASALSAPDSSDEGGLGALGGLGGPESLTVCVSAAPLDLFAERDGAVEPVGRLDAGTRFVRSEARADGALVVRPPPGDGIRVDGERVAWLARGASAPLDCHEEQNDPSTLFAAARGPAATTLHLDVIATVASGLRGTAVGSSCMVEVEHFPGDHFACRATVRCGETVLFGTTPTNGFFECALTGGATPAVSGRDAQTSSASGDAALTLDSTRRTVIVVDDATGPNGAFHLEARIDAIVDRTGR